MKNRKFFIHSIKCEKKRNLCKNKNFGIFVIFLVDFIKLLLATAILSILVVIILANSDKSDHVFTMQDYKDNLHYLQSGDYESFPIDKVLGSYGNFVVLDSTYTVIYNSSTNNVKYNEDLLKFIPDLEGQISMTIRPFYDSEDGKKYLIKYLFSENSYEIDFPNEYAMDYIAVDKSLNIESTTFSTNIDKFTSTEFESIFGFNWPEEEVKKSTFTSFDNSAYQVILYKTSFSQSNAYKKNRIFIRILSIIYFLCIGILLIFFIFGLYKKVKKPIDYLNRAIDDFSGGNKKERIDYKGPKEFVEICSNFNSMADELEQAERNRIEAQNEKQKMLSDISHDLKTPITIIDGYAKAIEDNRVKDKELNEYLKSIRTQSKLLTSLINRFNEYNKLERPDFRLNMVKTDICESSRKFFIEKYNNLEFLGYKLDIDIPDEIIYVNLDEFNFNRVYQNIISNTIKYNKPGTTIRFSIKTVGVDVIINLSDDGVGIPTSIKESLFDAFTVGDDSRSSELGTGLGLSIVKKVVTLHGGTIELISSEDNDGSTYKIALKTYENFLY